MIDPTLANAPTRTDYLRNHVLEASAAEQEAWRVYDAVRLDSPDFNHVRGEWLASFCYLRGLEDAVTILSGFPPRGCYRVR